MYILASDKYCTICNGNCKSIHACKLFMLSPSLPTHPFYLTCLEFVGRMCSSHSCFMFWNFFFFPLPHSCFSAATQREIIKVSSPLGLSPPRKKAKWGKLFGAPRLGCESEDAAEFLTNFIACFCWKSFTLKSRIQMKRLRFNTSWICKH